MKTLSMAVLMAALVSGPIGVAVGQTGDDPLVNAGEDFKRSLSRLKFEMILMPHATYARGSTSSNDPAVLVPMLKQNIMIGVRQLEASAHFEQTVREFDRSGLSKEDCAKLDKALEESQKRAELTRKQFVADLERLAALAGGK